ncbi:MAG: SurA N-terminal domain-containing protein [Hyphomonadaceae bacterium]|nr:SurA N-terminal domain-containing protein [Hyphomonadaceae bacterium]
MLAQLRNMTRGVVAYVLLFLLTIAFAIWGINDMFGGIGSQYVASVAGQNVTPAQLTRELELTLRAQRTEEGALTTQEAVDQGLHVRLLEGIIGRHALLAFGHRIGLNASDRMVADRIRGIPAVVNPVTGTFDEAAYDAFLQQLRYTRREFENDIRGDITRAMLMNALVSGVRAPSSFGSLALTYETETRVVTIAEAPASAVGAIPPPTEEQLQQFWEESQDNLRLPEFRTLTLIYARPQDFLSRVTIPEARLQEELEARRAALTQAERRSFVRVTAQNEAQASDIAARLGRGETAAAIAEALSVTANRVENQTQAEVTDARVAEAVFGMQRGQTRVVRGELSPFVVVRLESITAPVAPDLATMREELRQAIALDEAVELLSQAISGFEDARGGGATALEAARANNLPSLTIPAVEAGGRDSSGAPVAVLEGQEEVLRTAFETPEGETSDFIPVGTTDGIVVSVDAVTPARVPPIDEVRQELIQVWTARERATRLRELGERMVAAVRGGQGFEAAARANRFNIVIDSQSIDRRTAAQIPARGLAPQIFGGAEGAVVSDIRADGGAVLVAIVETINRVDPAEQPQQVELLRLQMQQGLVNSFGTAIQDEIVAAARPRRNQALLDQAFRRSDQGADEEQ